MGVFIFYVVPAVIKGLCEISSPKSELHAHSLTKAMKRIKAADIITLHAT